VQVRGAEDERDERHDEQHHVRQREEGARGSLPPKRSSASVATRKKRA
jgi:hypothetical protein